MDEPVRIAVIGAGLIGQAVHIPTLRRMSEFQLVAVGDTSAKVCQELGARYPEIRTYTDWRRLLDSHALDAVVICSPNATHAEIALEALDAGLHLLVEKPLAITLDDIDEIERRASEKGLVVQVGYMKRFDAAYERLIDALPTRADGLRLIDVVTFDPWMARPPFAPADLVIGDDIPEAERAMLSTREREQVEAAVGPTDTRSAWIYSNVYLGALIHDVNLVHGLISKLGMTVPASPITASHRLDGKAAHVTFELDRGVVWSNAWLLLDQVGVFEETANLYFEDCIYSLRFGAPYFRESAADLKIARGVGPGSQHVEQFRRIKDSYLGELEHFYACIGRGAKCLTPPKQARLDLVALEHAFRAANHSRPRES